VSRSPSRDPKRTRARGQCRRRIIEQRGRNEAYPRTRAIRVARSVVLSRARSVPAHAGNSHRAPKLSIPRRTIILPNSLGRPISSNWSACRRFMRHWLVRGIAPRETQIVRLSSDWGGGIEGNPYNWRECWSPGYRAIAILEQRVRPKRPNVSQSRRMSGRGIIDATDC